MSKNRTDIDITKYEELGFELNMALDELVKRAYIDKHDCVHNEQRQVLEDVEHMARTLKETDEWKALMEGLEEVIG